MTTESNLAVRPPTVRREKEAVPAPQSILPIAEYFCTFVEPIGAEGYDIWTTPPQFANEVVVVEIHTDRRHKRAVLRFDKIAGLTGLRPRVVRIVQQNFAIATRQCAVWAQHQRGII